MVGKPFVCGQERTLTDAALMAGRIDMANPAGTLRRPVSGIVFPRTKPEGMERQAALH